MGVWELGVLINLQIRREGEVGVEWGVKGVNGWACVCVCVCVWGGGG